MAASLLNRLFFPAILLLCVAMNSVGELSPASASGDVRQWLEGQSGVGLKPYAEIPLQPQWIGMVTKTVLRDPDKIHDEEKPDPMRLNAVWRNLDGSVVIARSGKDGHISSDVAVYRKELPSLDELRKATKLSELRHWFGPQHDWTDCWVIHSIDHWSEGWTYFTTTQDGRLRWLHVFALVAGPRGAKADTGEIETLTVSEGFFRTADPTSEVERLAYPSAEALEAAAEAARETERAKIPEPLLSLVAAAQKQGDFDLLAYKNAITAIRRDPQSELFAQMAARIDDGTCVMQGMVEAIFFENFVPNSCEPWNLKKKQLAIRHALAAIDQCATPTGLETWTEILLQALGGGHIQLKAPDGTSWMDLKVKIEGDTKTLTTDGNNITDEDLAAAKQAIRKMLIRKFPILKPE